MLNVENTKKPVIPEKPIDPTPEKPVEPQESTVTTEVSPVTTTTVRQNVPVTPPSSGGGRSNVPVKATKTANDLPVTGESNQMMTILLTVVLAITGISLLAYPLKAE